MVTTHKTTIVGKCPHGCPDVYDAEFIVHGRVLVVEAIQQTIDALTAEPIYQEDLTAKLSRELGCHVVTRGKHGRFDTECRVEHRTNNPK